jgi:peroxiredoxin Q/BCP
MPILSWLFERPLSIGEPAPDFTLEDQDGKRTRLSEFRGRNNVVLVFYPGDDTSVCTKQLCEFRDSWSDSMSKSCLVLGVNPQNAESHRKFITKQSYPFSLLVDTDQQVAKQYHASGLMVRRTVYLIGKDGTIRFAKRGKPAPADVLEAAQ